jgi:Rrf2 family iron-sulfur cluster assembly transcriptional regulator
MIGRTWGPSLPWIKHSPRGTLRQIKVTARPRAYKSGLPATPPIPAGTEIQQANPGNHAMQVKTKGRIAVTAMIDLALNCGRGPVSLTEISRRQGISLSYLEQLFGKLRRQQFVESTRGPGGGYRLCRPADEISVADLVAAVDDALAPDALELEADGGEFPSRLDTQALWSDLGAQLTAYLASISLQSLVEGQRAEGVVPAERPKAVGILPRPIARSPRVRGPNSVFALAGALPKATAGR